MPAKLTYGQPEQKVMELADDTSVRKNTGKALLESEKEYGITLDDLLVGVVVHASDTSILKSNSEATNILGLTQEQMLGKKSIDPAWHFVHKDSTVMKAEDYPVSRVLSTKAPIHGYVAGINRPDRDYITWVIVNASPVFSKENELERVVVNFVDITDRKQAEGKIYRQSALLKGINSILRETLGDKTEEALGEVCLSVTEELTGSKVGFIGEIGKDGLLHDIAMSQSGWEACRMIDQSGHRKPPGDFQVHGIYGRVLKDGRGFFTNDPANYSDSIGLPTGHPPLTAFLGVPLMSEDQTIGMIAVGNREGGYTHEDLETLEALAPVIVEAFMHKRVETASERAEEALRENEEKFRLIAESSAEVIWNLDLGGKVTYVSPAVEKMLGYTREGAMHLDPRSFFSKSELGKAAEVFSNAVAGKRSQLVEFTAIRKDGSSVLVELSVTPVSKDETIVGVQGIARDITQRKEAEVALKESEAQKKAILDASIDVIRLVDKDLKIIWANKTTKTEFKVNPEQVVGRRNYKQNKG